MRITSCFAVPFLFTLLGTELRADDVNPKIDFDRGAAVETVIKNFRRLPPIGKTALEIPKQGPGLIDADVEGKGTVIGVDLIARILNSRPYNDASKYPPLIEDLPPAVRDPLRAEWAAINVIRSELLADADALEREDAQLVQEGIEIDRNLEVLERRRVQLSAEIDQFNRSCTGRPLPPDEYNRCVAWQNDLTRRIAQYNADVAAHNKRVDAWHAKALDLKRRAGTASKREMLPSTPGNPNLIRVRSWELNKIDPYGARSRQALEARCGKLISIEINPSAPQIMGTRGETLPFHVYTEHEPPQDKPCPVKYLWTPLHNVGNIGTVFPLDKRDAALTSGDQPGKGFVRVEVTDTSSNIRFSKETRVEVLDTGETHVVFQAQGDDIPGHGKSFHVRLPIPYLCVEAGEQALMELRQMLTDSEYRRRNQAIVKAGAWMRKTANTGGLQGPQENFPFYNDNREPHNARIDIEIWRGKAFVHCPVAKGAASN